MPTARAPLSLAIWPTSEPTAPEAADTTTVSPGCGLPDLEKPGVGGHARHAEHAERGRDRRQRRIDLSHPLAVGDRVGLPAVRTEHDIARGKAVDGSTPRPRSPCGLPSPARWRPAWRRTAHRSCARAYRDRATATACAAASRPPQAAGPASPRRENRFPSARRQAAPQAGCVCPSSTLTPGSDSSGSRA